MDSTTFENNRFNVIRDFAKPHGHTHILIESCQRNLDSFFTTFESLRMSLLSVIDDYEKLLRDTSLENGLKTLKETITWIFEPVTDSTLSLSSNARAAFSDLSEIITQRNRGLKEFTKKNDSTMNGTDGQQANRGYGKMSKQEINNQKARILQPCIEQLIEMLVLFFQQGLQGIYSQQDLATPTDTYQAILTPTEQDTNQVTSVFNSLPSVLQVSTANWFVASQTGADIRQEDISPSLFSRSDSQEEAAYVSKQLIQYREHLEKSPFKRFQVMGGYQYNPSDLCRAMERCVTEQELRELNEFYLQEVQGVGEGVVTCKMPQNTSYAVDGVDISGDEGRVRVSEEIERLCNRVCGVNASSEARRGIANFITYEVCSEMPEKSAWISTLLLYGKAYLVNITKYLADGERNTIHISQMEDRIGLRIEEKIKWKIATTNAVENWGVTSKHQIAVIETCYRKDFEFKTSEDAILIETVDVRIDSINSEFSISKPNLASSHEPAEGDLLQPIPPRHTHTHRTFSLPPSSGDLRDGGEREKPQGGHQVLQHTLSLHLPEETGRYGAFLRRESRLNHFSSSRSKTGSSESISSASTLKAGNPVFFSLAPGGDDGTDDVRQQLFQETAFQHLPMNGPEGEKRWDQSQERGSWSREEAPTGQESGTERSRDFFLDLFCKTNQDLNSPNQKEAKRPSFSPGKDRSTRTHTRTKSTDFSQPLTSPPPGRHQSVNNLTLNSSVSSHGPGEGDMGQDWISSLSSDNKCQSWPSLFGVLDLDASPPKDSHTDQQKSKDAKLEEGFEGAQINTLFSTFSLTEDSKDFHSSDSEIWPSKTIWGGEGLKETKRLPRSISLSSDSDSEGKDSFPKPKEITRTKYKTAFSEGKHPKVRQVISPCPPPFSPANSIPPRPIYHQPSPPPPPPPPHWDPKCHTDPNLISPRNPHPPHPPPMWNGAPWHEGGPPMPMPPMHGPHGPQWGPPPPGANMPPHPHSLPHPPPQGPPPHALYHNPPPPPPHFPPPPVLHATPSPDSPRAPHLPPHQGISGPPLPPNAPLHPPTTTGPPHPSGSQPPLNSQPPPPSNSPIPPNQPPPPQYHHPYPPPMHHSMMDPSHLHNQRPHRGPPPYFVQRMPHQPHPNFYPIPNSNW